MAKGRRINQKALRRRGASRADSPPPSNDSGNDRKPAASQDIEEDTRMEDAGAASASPSNVDDLSSAPPFSYTTNLPTASASEQRPILPRGHAPLRPNTPFIHPTSNRPPPDPSQQPPASGQHQVPAFGQCSEQPQPQPQREPSPPRRHWTGWKDGPHPTSFTTRRHLTPAPGFPSAGSSNPQRQRQRQSFSQSPSSSSQRSPTPRPSIPTPNSRDSQSPFPRPSRPSVPTTPLGSRLRRVPLWVADEARRNPDQSTVYLEGRFTERGTVDDVGSSTGYYFDEMHLYVEQQGEKGNDKMKRREDGEENDEDGEDDEEMDKDATMEGPEKVIGRRKGRDSDEDGIGNGEGKETTTYRY